MMFFFWSYVAWISHGTFTVLYEEQRSLPTTPRNAITSKSKRHARWKFVNQKIAMFSVIRIFINTGGMINRECRKTNGANRWKHKLSRLAFNYIATINGGNLLAVTIDDCRGNELLSADNFMPQLVFVINWRPRFLQLCHAIDRRQLYQIKGSLVFSCEAISRFLQLEKRSQFKTQKHDND